LVGHVAHMGKMRNAYKILFRKTEGKRPLDRLRHRQEGNIKMHHEIGYKEVDWIRRHQWQAVNLLICFHFP